MMTKQEAFDRVARHLLQQAARSEGGSGCLYRCPDGRKCAIGCLIADKDYDPKMECKSIYSHVFQAWRAENLGVGDNTGFVDFLNQLRHIHDNHLIAAWPNSLLGLADQHGLEPGAARIEQDEWSRRIRSRLDSTNAISSS